MISNLLSFKTFLAEDITIPSHDPMIVAAIGSPKKTPACRSFEKGKALQLDRYGAWIHPKKDWIMPVGPYEHEFVARNYFDSIHHHPAFGLYASMFLQGWVRTQCCEDRLLKGKFMLFVKGFPKDCEQVIFPLLERFKSQINGLMLTTLDGPRFWCPPNSPPAPEECVVDIYTKFSDSFTFPNDLAKLFNVRF